MTNQVTRPDEVAARAAALERALAKQIDVVAAYDAQLVALEQHVAEAGGDFAPPTAAAQELA